jgi:starch synthase
MQILVVTAEIAPFTGTGPIPEAIAALPKALRGLGHSVTVVSPLLSGVDPTARALARRLNKVDVTLGDETLACEVYDGRTAGGLDLLFVGHPEVLGRAPSIAEEGDRSDAAGRRASLFARAAVALGGTLETPPAVISAHGWVGGLAIAHARHDDRAKSIPTVLTVHEPASQGAFGSSAPAMLGLGADDLADARQDGTVNALLLGLRRADQVVTVSPTFATEITTPPHGHGLENAFASLGERLSGIVDGLDASLWNPATDARIASRYDPMDLRGKARDKAHLQRALELPIRDDVPLLLAVARPGRDAGFDLLADATPALMRNDCQLVVLFEGDERDPLRATFAALSERWPDRLQARGTGDGTLVHEAYAAADLVVVPSRREPCGHAQLVAHRYGALPIARRTGGLADTVVDCDAKLTTGSGFIFDQPTPDDLLAATRRALAAFGKQRAFETLQGRVMRVDHSWERSARLYERTFRAAADARRR